ncbi:MAG: hypothetical protein ACT4P6_09275 [Gemmatimonadaceae bacterium]
MRCVSAAILVRRAAAAANPATGRDRTQPAQWYWRRAQGYKRVIVTTHAR